jgi:hypothetical protein
MTSSGNWCPIILTHKRIYGIIKTVEREGRQRLPPNALTKEYSAEEDFTMSVKLDSVRRLLVDSRRFDGMTSAEQGAFRARLTRYLNKVEDEQLREILEALQERVGKAEPRGRDSLTVEDVAREFSKFLSYDNRKRAAYKAKVTRLANKAEEEGDAEAVERLQAIQAEIATLEERDGMDSLINIAEELGLT